MSMLIYRTKGVLELLEKNYRIYASLNSMASLSYCTLVATLMVLIHFICSL